MKKLLVMGLLAVGAAAHAQDAETAKRRAESDAARTQALDAKHEAESTKSEADARKRLAEARERLEAAAREVAEISGEMGASVQRDVRVFRTEGGPRTAVLGVQIDTAGVKEGARVNGVSPGGAAEEAGLQTGDVIISLDGKAISGGEGAGRALVTQMRDVKPEQKVRVRVLRAGKNKDFIVVARPRVFEGGNFAFGGPESDGAIGSLPEFRTFTRIFPNEFGGMELASLTPKLGEYFGTREGVLVVQAPDNGAFKLEDGDVIQSIDGRKPDDGAHALRILRSYKEGEKLNLSVLRQRKPLTLAVTMPDRPEFNVFESMPPPGAPPLAPLAPLAPVPGT